MQQPACSLPQRLTPGVRSRAVVVIPATGNCVISVEQGGGELPRTDTRREQPTAPEHRHLT